MGMDGYYYKLLRLVRLLHELQDQEGVRHDFGPLLKSRLQSKKYIELADLLIRQMTLLRRTSRDYDQGVYWSEKEDLAAAVQLLLGEFKNAGLLRPETEIAYLQLSQAIHHGQTFTRKDVQRITGYSKTQSWRLLKSLEQQEKIKRVGGMANTGYYYRLVQLH